MASTKEWDEDTLMHQKATIDQHRDVGGNDRQDSSDRAAEEGSTEDRLMKADEHQIRLPLDRDPGDVARDVAAHEGNHFHGDLMAFRCGHQCAECLICRRLLHSRRPLRNSGRSIGLRRCRA